MARGNDAKDYVIERIKNAFGEDFVGIYDKKVYVWSKEDGEKIQVCLSLTCPQVPVGDAAMLPTVGGGLDFEAMDTIKATSNFKPAEITKDEQANIEELMKKLGL